MSLRFAFLALMASATLFASAFPPSTERADASSTELVGYLRTEAMSSTASRACAIRTTHRGIPSRLMPDPSGPAQVGSAGTSFFWPALFPVPPPTV